MKRTTRGEQILNRLVKDSTCELTESGKNWLIQILDPYHDRPFVKTGWPANNTRPSLVRQVKQSISVSATSGGGAAPANPWDLHIAWLPVMNAYNYSPSKTRMNNTATVDFSNGSRSDNVGGLIARGVFSTGADVVWMAIPGSTTNLGQISIDPQYLTGDSRLVGVGWEVTDTSAEINKQGSLCVYSYPQKQRIETYSIFADSPPAGTIDFSIFEVCRITLPPTNLKQAMLLPDSKIWEAKWGAYMVPTFQDMNNIPGEPSTVEPLLEAYTSNPNATPGAGFTDKFYIPFVPSGPSQVSGTVTFGTRASGMYKIAPTNTNGVVLSGLNPQSTFTLSLVYYIETIPSGNDPSLVVLTQPPPPFDPVALEIYSRVSAKLPPGVFVGENDAGEWFWNVVGDIANVLHPVVKAIPQTAFLADTVNSVGNAARQNATRNKPKEKKKEGTLVKATPSSMVKPKKPLPPIPPKKK